MADDWQYGIVVHGRWSESEEPRATVIRSRDGSVWHDMCTTDSDSAHEILESVQELCAENEQLRAERDDLRDERNHWVVAHRELRAVVDALVARPFRGTSVERRDRMYGSDWEAVHDALDAYEEVRRG